MNHKRWRIVLAFLGMYVVLFALGLLYRVTHRGYPPTVPFEHCVWLAFIGCCRFATSITGILILLGFIFWFCSSSTKHDRR